jgi:hypothetical protein
MNEFQDVNNLETKVKQNRANNIQHRITTDASTTRVRGEYLISCSLDVTAVYETENRPFLIDFL